MTLGRLAYTTLLRLATPALLAHFRRRARRQTATADDWRARLGYIASDTRHPIWIHAASAGEMQAALPLAAKLTEHFPVRLSAFSASGLARAQAHLPDVPATLAPLDTPGAWRRFLDRSQPRLLILTETELWPNLLAICAARHIPAVLVSARLTPAGSKRLARLAATTRAMLNQLSGVYAQSEDDLARFIELGLPAEKGHVTGNLKTALTIPSTVRTQAETWRAGPFAGRRVWVAGSVREGEEAFVADATQRIHETCPEAIGVIVPRHPERAPLFTAALQANGIDPLDASSLDSFDSLDSTDAREQEPLAPGSTLIVDRLGVLLALYAAGDVAFVGGSIAPLGGHNLLEPALLGKPVLAGPHLENVRNAAKRLKQAGGLVVVEDAGSLAQAVASLLQDQGRCRMVGEAAHGVASQPETLARTLAALAPFTEAFPTR